MASRKALQSYFPKLTCFGCGPANIHGLRIISYWNDDEQVAVCTWQAQSYHSAGIPNVTQGGILATVIDCHCVWTAIAQAYYDEQRVFGSEPMPGYVSGTVTVKYARPTPMDQPMLLRAKVIEKSERKCVVSCSVSVGGVECVTAEVIVIRLKESPYAR